MTLSTLLQLATFTLSSTGCPSTLTSTKFLNIETETRLREYSAGGYFDVGKTLKVLLMLHASS